MIVEIRRNIEPEATIGTVIVGGEVLCFSLELPYYGNRRNVSCIPPGVYICTRSFSPKFGEVYKVNNVYQRSNILIHSGNTVDDIEGCIVLGMRTGYINDKRAVLKSKEALKAFYRELDSCDEFKLIIK